MLAILLEMCYIAILLKSIENDLKNIADRCNVQNIAYCKVFAVLHKIYNPVFAILLKSIKKYL